MCEMCKVVSLNFFIAIKSKVLTRPRNIYDERYKVKVHRKNKLRTEKKNPKIWVHLKFHTHITCHLSFQ